jgi:hypothetical protein
MIGNALLILLSRLRASPKIAVFGVVTCVVGLIPLRQGSGSSWSTPPGSCNAKTPPPNMLAKVSGIVCTDAQDQIVGMAIEPWETDWAKEYGYQPGERITSQYPFQICNGGNSIRDEFVWLAPDRALEKPSGPQDELPPDRALGQRSGPQDELHSRCNGRCMVFGVVGGETTFSFINSSPPVLDSVTIDSYPVPPALGTLPLAIFKSDYGLLVRQFLNLSLQSIQNQFDDRPILKGLKEGWLADISKDGSWTGGKPLTKTKASILLADLESGASTLSKTIPTVGAVCGVNYTHCCLCCKDKSGSFCLNRRPAVCGRECCP